MKDQLWAYIEKVRKDSPLVHNITNYVVMNNTANALLAVGASPIMAHAEEEVDEMVGISGSLVINIGTLDNRWTPNMRKAALTANRLSKPWVLDPVGVGATVYRNSVVEQFMQINTPSVIRGNASEIMAAAKWKVSTKGVDSSHKSDEALIAAKKLHERINAVVCVSGPIDYILFGNDLIALMNGHPLMAKVTGMGCTASALIGAFCAISEPPYFKATAAAMALMGVAGEIAAEQAHGPGTLQLHFLDALYSLTEENFIKRVKLENRNVDF